jgi:proteic killer suppression protein
MKVPLNGDQLVRMGESELNAGRPEGGELNFALNFDAVWIVYRIPAYGIVGDVIQSFRDKDTREVFEKGSNRQWNNVASVARRKLLMIHAAQFLSDLKAPPANRLEALRGNREGQHSIRINDRFRICFEWRADGPHEVEIVDYH